MFILPYLTKIVPEASIVLKSRGISVFPVHLIIQTNKNICTQARGMSQTCIIICNQTWHRSQTCRIICVEVKDTTDVCVPEKQATIEEIRHRIKPNEKKTL